MDEFNLLDMFTSPRTFCELYDFNRKADGAETPRQVGYYAACNIVDPCGAWYVHIYPEERQYYGITAEYDEFCNSHREAARRAYALIGY